MFFAKGEIIMNNIYKVIWSKAKNCYVVASEIAKSHTKSASGSEKMGGYGKKALLALAAASAIFCGGLVNVGAVDTVHVDESGTPLTAHEVYTKDAVDTTFATKTEVNAKADSTTVTEQGTKITQLETAVGNTYTKAEADGKFATSDALNTAKTDLDGKIAANTTKITANETAITDLKNKAGTTDATLNGLTSRMTTAESDIDVLQAGMTTAQSDIGTLKSDMSTAKSDIISLKTKDTELSGRIDTEINNRITSDTALDNKINAEITNRIISDTALDNKINKEIQDRDAADAALEGKINAEKTARENKDNELEGKITTLDGKVTTDITGLQAKDTELEGRIHTNEGYIETNKNAIAAIDKRTAGIGRIDATSETTIENNVKVDSIGNVTAEGKLTGKGVDAGTGDITTTGAVNAGSLNVTDASHLKGDVTMDKTLSVTGDTSLGALNVTGESSLKNTQVNGTLTTTGKATFKEAVDMDKGLTVTSGDTTLQNTDVKGALNVTGESSLKNTKVDGMLTTTGKATFQEAVEMDKGLTVTGDTKLKATTVDGKLTAGDADLKNTKVEGTLGVTGEATLDGALTAKGEAKFEKNVTVEKDLTVNGKLNVGEIYMKNDTHESTGKTHDSATAITADGISNRAKVTDENGNTTESKFTHNEKGTFNYAKDEKITGEWKGATSNVTADGVSNKMTDSAGNTHTYYQTAAETKEQLVNGNKSNFEKKTAEGNTISITEKDAAGNVVQSLTNKQTVKGEKTSVTNKNSSSTINQGADQIRNNVTSKDGTKSSSTEVKADGITNTSVGTITNDAKNLVNNATDKITDQVGSNTRVIDQTSITDTVGTASRKIEDGKITDTAGDSTVTTEKDKGTTFTKTGSTAYGEGGPTDTNISGNLIQTGRIESNELKVSDKDGDNTADLNVKAGEGVTASASDGNTTGSLDVKANEVGSSVKDAARNGSDFRQRIDAIMGNVKTADGESEVTQKGNEITSVVGKGETTNSRVTQKKDMIESAVTDGTNTNDRVDTASASAKKLTDGTRVNKLQDNLDSSVKTITNGTYTTSKVQTALNITNTAKDGTITNDAKNLVNNATDKITDQVGSNTRVIDQTSITDTVGTASRKIEDGKITDTAGDSTVTTEKDKGTTFTKRGSMAYRDGGPTDTNISGNTITTGKVTMDYADVMKDLGVRGNANITGTTTTKTLKVTENATVGGTLDVTQKATFHDDVDIKKNLSVDGNATIKGDVTASSYKVGDKTYISAAGINANDQKITNVADGSISEGSKDAVNGGQLYGVKRDLEHQVDKVGANAAAMANLRPMEFDPSSKWNIAAAIGNYGSETAAALGAFYRPNDDVMVNLSTAFGTGENMVGGGVSVRLGKSGNKLSREESNALKAQVDDLTARMDALLSVLNPNMSKDFPDVPENHWAYEAVSRLAGNDIVQGYPDGEFHGERTMTRYEMAEIIYNALSRGAEAERELVEEFKPELQAMAASEKATAEKAEG